MSPHFGFVRPLGQRTSLAISAAALLVIAGCATSPTPPHGSEESVAAAVGVENAVVFRSEGGPLDEPGTAAGTLTRSDAVVRALRTDPELQSALARVRVAQADADQARLLPNPVLNVVLRWGPGKPQMEASLAGDLVQALQIPHRASAADNRLRAAAADAVTVALDVVSQVEERYTAVQASAALTPLLRERLGLLEKLGATAKARLDAGEGTRGDFATVNAQRVELLVEIDAALITEREERLRLARLIGEPSSAAAWTLEQWATPSIGTQPEAAWVEAGLAHRPEVQSVVWRMKALGDDAALASLLPWEGGGVGIDAQRDGEWFAGPSVSTPLPIFDTGQAAQARTAAQQVEARHELTLARRKVVEEVRIAFATLSASRANLGRIQNELLPLQRERRHLAEEGYKAGQTDVTALFFAEGDLRAAEAQSIEVERQAAAALVRLQRAVGGAGVARALALADPAAPLAPAPEVRPVSTFHTNP